MSIQAVGWTIDQYWIPAGPTLVLVSLCNALNNGTGRCDPSLNLIAKEARCTKRSAQRHLAWLAARGLIEIEAAFDPSGRQRPHRYKVNRDPAEQHAAKRRFEEAQSLAAQAIDDAGEGANLTPSLFGLAPVDELGKTGGEDDTMSWGRTTPESSPRVTQESPLEPEDKPEEEPLGAQARGGLFESLWESWPKEALPDSMDVARRIFARLNGEEKAQAVEHAKTFRMLRRVRLKGKPRMIVYLQTKAFNELAGAPPLDREGYFRITPDRPEWKAWLRDVETRWGASGVEIPKRDGFMVRESRWPASSPKEHRHAQPD